MRHRARQALRGGWNAVQLDRKLIEKLHSRGVYYTQEAARNRPQESFDMDG